MSFLAACLAVVGHAALSIFVLNRVHSFALPCWVLRAAEALIVLLAAAFTVVVPVAADPVALLDGQFSALNVYAAVCIVVAIVPMPLRLWQRMNVSPPAVLLSNHTRRHDVRSARRGAAYRGVARALAYFPFNESLSLAVSEKTLVVPRLPAALDGLSIAHLSDLHFTGLVTRDYFDEVIDRALALDADLIAVTGDLVESTACFDWIEATFGRLRAPLGAYFILGNHDKRIDHRRLRVLLAAAGLIDAAGAPRRIRHAGAAIDLAGNELPWFPLADDIEAFCCTPRDEDALRLLLAHSPDQLAWARERDFDLVLAGHTHGGQVRLPKVGAIVAPSRHGVLYASGTFHEPPTVMHVSRGISAEKPLRWNCMPELAKLVLRCQPSLADADATCDRSADAAHDVAMSKT